METPVETEETNAVSDAIAAAAGTANSDRSTGPTQTRFRFYEPEEPVDENKEEKDESANAQRFNFYDDATRQELAAVENNIRPSQHQKPNTPSTALNASVSLNPLDSTDDILRSLQETEEQRLSILQVEDSSNGGAGTASTEDAGSNPYEDAIKEALNLLRKHRTPPVTPAEGARLSMAPTDEDSTMPSGRPQTPREQDRLLQHRMDDKVVGQDASARQSNSLEVDTTQTANAPSAPSPLVPEGLTDAYEEHKLKAKQRQERMAQYASRLQEFKSSLPSETVEQHWPPSITNNQSNVESYVLGETGESQMGTTIPHVPSHNEDSVGFSDLSHSTKEQVEAEVQRGVERVLLAILERANSSRGRASAQGSEGGEPQVEGAASGTDKGPTSSIEMSDALIRAMDELGLSTLSTATSGDFGGGDPRKLRTKTSGETEGTGTGSKKSVTSVVDELLAEDDDDDADGMGGNDFRGRASKYALPSPAASTGAHYTPSWGPREEKKLPDSQEKQAKYDEIVEDDVEDHVAYSEDGSPSRNMTGVLGPLSKKAGGTTGVVLDIDQDDDQATSTTADKYETPYAMEGDYDDANQQGGEDTDIRQPARQDEGEDTEATELMRTLCAHLLPFGVDHKSNQLLEAIPDWDESNPNEAGYRIIRLSRAQLRRVEVAFDTMINGLKLDSERQLNGVEQLGDAKFARELREAERLLDESEVQQSKAANTSLTKQETTVAVKSKDSGVAKVAPPTPHNEEECGHPNFPGVKSTGKGEMGDLEYFHLPIVFKSHVTGFEPTKDLVLEPGNVVAGQYLVESELGSAAFSTAYRCIDLSSENIDGHEEVCLKVIKNTKDFFDQSLDEIKILELLRQTGQVHENHIVEMKCFFYYREHLIIVTELLRQNLFEFGKFIMDNNEEPYFTVPRLAYITRQALIALRFVHSLGLVHSDVKPENILLGSYSRAKIKLIDFGSSCYLTDRQSSYIQSRSYRAPEVVLGLPYDGKIDVWSLGCVVAEMYTGEVTFQNDSIVSMLSRIEAICGHFPRHMIAQGRQSGRFFTKSGLLYEIVGESGRGDESKTAPGPDDDEEEDNTTIQFDIFQPKNTRFSARMGLDADLMDDFDGNHKQQEHDSQRHEEQMFTDFVRKLLTIDPDGRPTADEALNHPWMQYAATLTEEDVKYPSS